MKKHRFFIVRAICLMVVDSSIKTNSKERMIPTTKIVYSLILLQIVLYSKINK